MSNRKLLLLGLVLITVGIGITVGILLIGSGTAADVPFVFDKNTSGIADYTLDQLENISKHAPEIAGVPPIYAPSNNEMVENISGRGSNNTYYLLPPDYSISDGGSVNSIGQDWFKTGNINYNEGNYNKSIECYEQAIQENPWFADAWYNKGTALGKLGRYEDALKAFDKALEINQTYAKARENRYVALHAIEQEKRKRNNVTSMREKS
jgi:tetratricopeptide (TPR) repeat protein